jgi:hypothetical protein
MKEKPARDSGKRRRFLKAIGGDEGQNKPVFWRFDLFNFTNFGNSQSFYLLTSFGDANNLCNHELNWLK